MNTKDDIIEALKVSQLNLRAENARLQERAEQTKKALNKTRKDDLEIMNRYADERDALQARMEEAEDKLEEVRDRLCAQIVQLDTERNWDTATEAERVTHREWDKTLDELAEAEARVEEAERRSHTGGWVCDCECHEEIDGLKGTDYKALAERRKKALVAIHKRATPRSQDFLHPTKEFADDVASMARAAIEEEENV